MTTTTREYGALLVDMKCTDLPMEYHQTLFSQKKNCFTGRDLVIWIVKYRDMEFKDAFAFACELLQMGLVVEIKDRKKDFDMAGRYKLLLDTERDGQLNMHLIGNFKANEMPALDMSKNLRITTTSLYSSYMNEEGSQVDYEKLQRSREFNVDYRNAVYALRFVNLHDLDDAERKCFFINIYNTLMINGLIVIGKPSGLLQKRNFFNYCKYNIGGHLYSLNDIEHGVLRANRKPVGALKKLFGKKDPRLEYIVQEFDPRIHFALNCGAKSCPPIKMYEPHLLDRQLKIAGINFCEQEVQVNETEKCVTVSKIFQWYYGDFGSNDEEVCRYIHTFLEEIFLQKALGKLLESGKFKLKFSTYDWSLNENLS